MRDTKRFNSNNSEQFHVQLKHNRLFQGMTVELGGGGRGCLRNLHSFRQAGQKADSPSQLPLDSARQASKIMTSERQHLPVTSRACRFPDKLHRQDPNT